LKQDTASGLRLFKYFGRIVKDNIDAGKLGNAGKRDPDQQALPVLGRNNFLPVCFLSTRAADMVLNML